MQVIVRIEYQHFQQGAKAYLFKIDGENVWLPKGSVTVTVNKGFQDLEMPRSLALEKGLGDYIVAEYPE